MKLYLVQHGEACSKEVDPDRPLTVQGRLDIDRMATFLKQTGIVVSRVIHSGKLRAQQTAKGLAKAIAGEVELVISDGINPNDDPAAFDWLNETGNQNAIIVSHLPFISNLVSYLLNNNEKKIIAAFEPGSVACLEQTENKHWQINWMIRPDLIR